MDALANWWTSFASTFHSKMMDRGKTCATMDRPDLLRGTSAAALLHNFGKIFRNSTGSQQTFEQSEPVSAIDVFISHNWSTPRLAKFLVLSLFFNNGAASVLVVAAMALVWHLNVFDANVLPMHDVVTFDGYPTHRGMWCLIFGNVAFVIGILCWHQIAAVIGRPGPRCFLDKTCIHQEDEETKQKGIESLAAFLARSRMMLILYTETYLSRLWTIYELASFLLLRPDGTIKVVPVFMPRLVYVGMIANFLCMMTKEVLCLKGMSSIDSIVSHTTASAHSSGFWILLLSACATWLVLVVFVWTLRRWAREQAQIFVSAQQFSIRDAVCFNEDDRPVVQGNIICFMQLLEIVPPGSSDSDALDAFDALVHSTVPHALVKSIGRIGIPFKLVLTMTLSVALSGADDLLGCLHDYEEYPRRAWMKALGITAAYLGWSPLTVAFMCYLTKQNMGLRGAAEWLWLSFICTLSAIITIAIYAALVVLGQEAIEESNTAVVLMVCWTLILLGLTFIVYREPNEEPADCLHYCHEDSPVSRTLTSVEAQSRITGLSMDECREELEDIGVSSRAVSNWFSPSPSCYSFSPGQRRETRNEMSPGQMSGIRTPRGRSVSV